MITTYILLCCFLCLRSSLAFAPHAHLFSNQVDAPSTTTLKCAPESHDGNCNRRSFVGNALTLAGFLVANPTTSHAVMDPSKNTKGTLKELSMEEAEERFRAGRAAVDYLLNNYNEVCDGGGDNVRRYLGTVGTQSGLFGISKAMKTLADKADDIVEYTELSREIEQCVEQADGSAYMAIFVTTSTSYTPPEKYFGDAKIEVKRLAKSMDELAVMLGITF
uniref:Uncharacterized protein n=1 Tax=Skeletonema marinoi TaxID=267567 RepID=A0A7S2PM38_9STRA|mmetsp:Transcript_24713/g.42030  ORF Transcript_24713/g.42030 Transcript_24713/m.42030 type:complete len:220 (+) Transcript_24713:215-874(+)